MRAALLFVSLSTLLLAGCLESDEEIDVHPDGSVTVEISAKAKESDLENGYPIPTGGPWSAPTRRDAGDDEIELRTPRRIPGRP
jgi:hypothetical protein